MTHAERVKQGLKCHLHQSSIAESVADCGNCPYNFDESGKLTSWKECSKSLYEDAVLLIDDMVNTIKLLEEEQ